MSQVPKNRTDLLPHYSRLVATLNKYMPDIGIDVVAFVRTCFNIVLPRYNGWHSLMKSFAIYNERKTSSKNWLKWGSRYDQGIENWNSKLNNWNRTFCFSPTWQNSVLFHLTSFCICLKSVWMISLGQMWKIWPYFWKVVADSYWGAKIPRKDLAQWYVLRYTKQDQFLVTEITAWTHAPQTKYAAFRSKATPLARKRILSGLMQAFSVYCPNSPRIL